MAAAGLMAGGCEPPTEETTPRYVGETWHYPRLVRTEKMREAAAVDGLIVKAAPFNAAGWRLTVTNDTGSNVLIVWDESSFVYANGANGGRLIRGTTRKLDTEKAQVPSPVAAASRLTAEFFVEKLLEAEDIETKFIKMEDEHGEINVPPRKIEEVRESLEKVIIGGELNLVLRMNGETVTWIGEVYDGAAPPKKPVDDEPTEPATTNEGAE